MITYIKGDLLEADCDIICHQVNCQGVMGSGVARQVRERWPRVFEEYRAYCQECNPLGHCLLVPVETRNRIAYVANLFGQDRYGYDGKVYTSYEAFAYALADLKDTIHHETGLKFAFPHKIASDRGGADWERIYEIIGTILKYDDVYIYYLNDEALTEEDKKRIEKREVH